jgi:CspA family cold shock protein
MKSMKPPVLLFGIVQSFDTAKGFGSIQPESGGEALRFENSAIKWNRSDSPRAEQRLSYELGTNADGNPCALNLQTIARTYL